jgi:hypothetical protein
LPKLQGIGTKHNRCQANFTTAVVHFTFQSQPMKFAQLSTLVDNAIVVWHNFHLIYSGHCCDTEGGEGCSCHETC